MALRILIVDDRSDRAQILRDGLATADYEIVGQVDGTQNLHAVLEHTPADVIITSLSSPDRDTLEDLRTASVRNPKPVVMFVEDTGTEMAVEAIRAGVAAYVVAGLSPARVRPIVEIAIARFKEFRRLIDELERSRAALAERRVVDQAKGILMERNGLTEPEAYALLRTTAMRQNQKLVELARSVIAAAELFTAKGTP